MTNEMNSKIISAMEWRYAVKVFDPTKKVSDADLHTILEAARLSPSSIGIEAWKFIVVNNPVIRAKLREAGFNQTKITDASHLIIIARRTDADGIVSELVSRTAKTQGKTEADLAGLQKMASGGFAGKGPLADSWVASQAYIPLGIMIETASLLGIDNGPMEGFDPAKVDEILGLSAKNLKSTTMLAIGYRGDDAFAKLPKTRRTFGEVVEMI